MILKRWKLNKSLKIAFQILHCETTYQKQKDRRREKQEKVRGLRLEMIRLLINGKQPVGKNLHSLSKTGPKLMVLVSLYHVRVVTEKLLNLSQ